MGLQDEVWFGQCGWRQRGHEQIGTMPGGQLVMFSEL
jgi:hypothetical protein